MFMRCLNRISIGLMLFLGACVSSTEPLQLGYEVQLLPKRALLQFVETKNDEFYKFTFHEGKFAIIEKGDEDTPLPAAFHKIPGLPDGYHVGWIFMGKGSIFEANYYNIVWLEKSSSGGNQLVMFAPSDENREAIAAKMKIDPKGGPQITNAEEMVRYAQTLYKMRDQLNLARLEIFDLAKKDDFEKAEALTGAEFLAE